MNSEQRFEPGFEQEIDLRDYWRILVKHRKMILACLGIAVATALLGSLAAERIYTASTTLQIEPDTPKILNFEEMFQVDATTDAFYQTQYRLIESRSLARRVILEHGLLEDPTFNQEPGIVSQAIGLVTSAPGMALGAVRDLLGDSVAEEMEDVARREEDSRMTRAINEFLDRLEVNPIRNTRLAEVAWSSPSPERAADITRAVGQTYIDMNLEAKFQTTEQASQFLATEIGRLQQEISEAEAELQQYGTERDILSQDDRQDVVSQALGDLNAELTRARAERVRREADYQSLRTADPSGLPQVANNRVVEDLQQDLGDLQQRRTEMARRFTEDWPEMQRLTAQIEELEQQIATEESRIFQGLVRQARSEYEAALDREQQLQGLLDEQKTEAQQLNRNLIAYRALQTQVENKRELLDSLLERQSETGVSARLQGQRTSNIRVVDEASVPLGPSSPNVRLNLLLSAIVGLMLGVGVAFTREYLDNTLLTPEDVEDHLGLPSLGLVPAAGSIGKGSDYGYAYSYGDDDYTEDVSAITTPELVAIDHPRSSLAEAYRTLRTSVLLSQAGEPPQVVLVTSSRPGEGKTTTAMNLAASLAQAGKRTLILDADLRKPRIHKILGGDDTHGLVSFLVGDDQLQDVVRTTRVKNLWALPCGPKPPNPAELLGSDQVQKLMGALRKNFDAIVIDSPPALAVVDPLELAPLADGVVLVARGGDTPHPEVDRAHRKIASVGGKVMGVLLNDVDLASIHYYGGSYRRAYRYDYGEPAATGAPEPGERRSDVSADAEAV